jgi:hypothetical protein
MSKEELVRWTCVRCDKAEEIRYSESYPAGEEKKRAIPPDGWLYGYRRMGDVVSTITYARMIEVVLCEECNSKALGMTVR